MAKKSEVPGRKELIKQWLASYEPKDAKDVQDLLKDMFKDTLQEMLNAELDNELGYSKYNYKEKETDNSRNGYSKKTVRSTLGDIELDIPRDRKGEFEPEIVKKNQKNVTGIEDQIISMYAKGMSTRDISSHLEDIYGIDASAEMISRITD